MEELNNVLNEELLLVNVLPRSPPEDVHRLKAVSKDWGSYLSSSRFSKGWCHAHRKNTLTELALKAVCPAKQLNLIHGDIHESLEIICSSNGHFCCVEKSLSTKLYFARQELSAWHRQPTVVSLAVCSPVFKQRLPQLTIEKALIMKVNMVVDPNGHYTIGFLTRFLTEGKQIDVYDSKIGEWRRHDPMAWPEADFTSMDMGSCVHYIQSDGTLGVYDFITHRRGSLKTPLPRMYGQYFHYGKQLFCASLTHPDALTIYMMKWREELGAEWARFDVPCFSRQKREVTAKSVLLAVEGNLLIAIVHLEAEENGCAGVIFDLENYTWSIHYFLEDRACIVN